MTVRDLLKEIELNKLKIGEDFLDYDVYTEQCTEEDKVYKRDKQGWEVVKTEEFEYFKCEGFSGLLYSNKGFTIHVNY